MTSVVRAMARRTRWTWVALAAALALSVVGDRSCEPGDQVRIRGAAAHTDGTTR